MAQSFTEWLNLPQEEPVSPGEYTVTADSIMPLGNGRYSIVFVLPDGRMIGQIMDATIPFGLD